MIVSSLHAFSGIQAGAAIPPPKTFTHNVIVFQDKLNSLRLLNVSPRKINGSPNPSAEYFKHPWFMSLGENRFMELSAEEIYKDAYTTQELGKVILRAPGIADLKLDYLVDRATHMGLAHVFTNNDELVAGPLKSLAAMESMDIVSAGIFTLLPVSVSNQTSTSADYKVQFLATLEDGQKVVVITPAAHSTNSEFRAFIGFSGSMREIKVTSVTIMRDGGTTLIETSEGRLWFQTPFQAQGASLTTPKGRIIVGTYAHPDDEQQQNILKDVLK